MKSTGILRKIDKAGRVVVPIELRKTLNIDISDYMEIFLEDNHVRIKKYEEFDRCAITGDITPQNRRYANGLVLSPLGAEILFNQLLEKQKELVLES
ncbi:AbrB/MazE/SpoVT family DNA-binding domain-containing protein [Priestia megaterium]|uniref:AbrB/MazE/SpoVT family DNA-binding domain-containing protein n=1 Tax=Priestia megaterium TaxID=1404 RepID=UPI001BE5CC6E|nr:AbrB/MazE/SpoVT family DNA-binding domain-containing protein [Priestia megaterium]MBT2259280.1 AbrB/MazE/SpoVT family DNA-binding domain-containing protein [Priestia megaterium]